MFVCLFSFVDVTGRCVLDGEIRGGIPLSYLPLHLFFEPRSLLRKLAEAWGYAPKYLMCAALKQDSPLERFKWVILFSLSALHSGKQLRVVSSLPSYKTSTDICVDSDFSSACPVLSVCIPICICACISLYLYMCLYLYISAGTLFFSVR